MPTPSPWCFCCLRWFLACCNCALAGGKH